MCKIPELQKASAALIKIVASDIEIVRRLRILSSLYIVSKGALIGPKVPQNCWGRKADGGWADVEESMWAINALDFLNGWRYLEPHCRDGSIFWIVSQKTTAGAWGKTGRDIARIPITGMLLTLLPELADHRAICWLNDEWGNDLASPVQLTYKAGFYLSALSKCHILNMDLRLITRTCEWLSESQNDDGGFAPWKNHPIGSEPWSTGIALIGLSAWPDLVNHDVLIKALDWLERKQLLNGLWPCHYIEEGSAYCYWGAVEALKVLKRAGHPCVV